VASRRSPCSLLSGVSPYLGTFPTPLARSFEELRVTVDEIIDAGDQVVLVAHHQGRGRKSGVAVDARYYEVYTLREGKVSRVDEFDEMAEALEAAGLSE
jgi:ketosteroid isomerase-like protein